MESYATENSRHSTNWLLTYSQVLGLRLIAWIEQMCSEIIYTGKLSEKTFSVIFNFYHQEWSISKHCWSIFKSFVFPYSINLIHVLHVCSTVWLLGLAQQELHIPIDLPILKQYFTLEKNLMQKTVNDKLFVSISFNFLSVS